MKSLISTKNLDKKSTEKILKQAQELASGKEILANGKPTVASLFYEASTRTRASFEIAAQKIGANVINLDPKLSSVNKGESLDDTAKTLANLGVNIVVVRHPSSGAALRLAKCLMHTQIGVINAGDGMNEHPTQALLDLLSIKQEYGDVENKKIAIVGDCLHSRVAKSNIYLLKTFGAEITLLGPPPLVPEAFSSMGVKVEHDFKKLSAMNLDLLMILRLQKERQFSGLIPSTREYRRYYGLDENFFINLPKQRKIRILHPGPVNRGIEISEDLVDNETVSLIHKQVSNGLYVRMAVLLEILGNNK
ncbi:MAG: aspartate carbamoyltransferase catalytic subunit [Candidatus Caenarcaniphilales bacterium]|nr:aspartate carbamoyltransferase catalytic subunit [Candidatus Caenarcaniphilales bacterium]